jgi:hypothetical protein
MTAVYGLYASPDSAQRAVNGLRAAGVTNEKITILSSEPLEEYEFAQRDRGTWMNWISAFGALIGFSIAYLLTSVTQQLWAIDTGGMPIVTNWTNMIILFELTMLGAVFAAVITFLLTAPIPSRPPAIYDPEISDGKILVGVANPPDAATIKGILRVGSAALKTIE